MLKFFYYYLRSMRLYYGFVTATTVLVGLCLVRFGTGGAGAWTVRDDALLAMGFLSWGFNQIFSDWCDRKEDAINAPHRPMVTGALKPLPAFAVSAAGLAAIAVAGYLMSPWTLAFLTLGGALNIAYSLLKRVPVLNCLVYACAISCCALFAIAGVAGRAPNGGELSFVAIFVLPAHLLMCHNSYYKDIAGDRAAGVRTLQIFLPRLARAVSGCLPCAAAALAVVVMFANGVALLSAFATLVVALAVAFLAAVSRGRLHRATCLNCQLCVLLLHLWIFRWTWLVAMASLVAIQLLFLWYNDEKE